MIDNREQLSQHNQDAALTGTPAFNQSSFDFNNLQPRLPSASTDLNSSGIKINADSNLMSSDWETPQFQPADRSFNTKFDAKDIMTRSKDFLEKTLSKAFNTVRNLIADPGGGGHKSHEQVDHSISSPDQPLIGIIDTGFDTHEHGSQILDQIQTGAKQAGFWLGEALDSGTWAKPLKQFVDVAKATGNSKAVANLSLDATQINPDGSETTRYQLTAQEQEALAYAQANGVLVVAAAGNQGGALSALGQASQKFDNVIAVGAANGRDRASYSNYGQGLDFLAPDGSHGLKGTSFSAAEATKTIANIWSANPLLNPHQVIQTLEDSAIDLKQPGWDVETVFGLINPSGAIELAKQAVLDPQAVSELTTNVTSPFINSAAIPSVRSASYGLPDGLHKKDSAKIDNLVPELKAVLPDIVQAYRDSGTGFSPLISSGHDGTHAPNSAHYKDRAIDLSSHDSDYSDYMSADEIKAIAGNITDAPLRSTPVAGDPGRLQSDWDRDGNGTRDFVLLVESPGIKGRQHIHIQVDSGNSILPSNLDRNGDNSDNNGGVTHSSSAFPGDLFVYEQGKRLVYDSNVQKWQEQMQKRGWNITADGLYGSESKRIATQFQIDKGLQVDGIVGPETWNASFDPNNITHTSTQPDHLFKYNPGKPLVYDADVQKWQERMQKRGWNITADGLYGSESKRIATQFQIDKGLQVDGVVGPETWNAAFDPNNITSPGSSAKGTSPDTGALLKTVTPDPLHPDYSGKMTANDSLSPNVRAFLDTISYAEGTYSPEGYRIRFGGKTFDGFDNHPRIHEPFRNTTSTAAGRYQFIQKTWGRVAKRLGLSDFSPENQDIAAVQRIRDRGAFEDVEAGRFEQAVGKLGEEWASFPGSPYGQPTKKLQDLRQVYEASLQKYTNSTQSSLSSGAEGVEIAFEKSGTSSDSQKASTREMLQYQQDKPMMEGDRVEAWQRFLNDQNLSRQIAEDGRFGQQTEALTTEFQRRHKLDDDGIVGSETLTVARSKGFEETNSSDSSTAFTPASSSVELVEVDGFKVLPAEAERSYDLLEDENSGLVRIERYDSTGPSGQTIEPNKETIVVTHGYDGQTREGSIPELAKQASRSGDVQVLALDWSTIAKANFDRNEDGDKWKLGEMGLPPLSTAEWIAPVARQAHEKLEQLGIDPNRLTLIGHSLGSYVNREIAEQFGKVKNLVALDPAFPTSRYDIDGSYPGKQSIGAFRDVADNSLAFVAKNNPFNQVIGGAAGDNDQAATAHKSFVLEFPDDRQRSAHTHVIDTFTDALHRGFIELPDLALPDTQLDQYSDNGNKRFFGRHEGRIETETTGLEAWRERDPRHPRSTGNPVFITGLTRVDASGREGTTWT